MSAMKTIFLLQGEDIFFDNMALVFRFFWERPTKTIFFFTKCMTPKPLYMEEWMINYNDFQFFLIFRLSKETFMNYVEAIARTDKKRIMSRPYIGGHYPVDIYGHILIFLKYIGTQESLLSIGISFKVCPATVMNIINKVLFFTLKLKSKYIRFPNNEEELLNVEAGFQSYPGKKVTFFWICELCVQMKY